VFGRACALVDRGVHVTRILHLSDLHFGPPVLPAVCEAVLERAETLEPEMIVVSGDLTQRAKRSEFEAAASFLARLPSAPRLVVPGNHDIPLFRFWERLRSPRALYRELIHPQVSRELTLPGAVVVGIDSTSPYRAIKGGRVSREQLRRCATVFSGAAADDWRIVVLHHHLIPAPTFARTRPMPRAQRALESLTEMKVDLVLAGHLHRAYVGNSLDVYAGKQRQSGIVVVQCGTSTSRRGRGREREANSMNLIEIEDDQVDVSHFMFFGEDAGFVPVSRHRFARPRRLSLATGLDSSTGEGG
jgi:3',5'-cyclic AMP phosphodiesterase CpdA